MHATKSLASQNKMAYGVWPDYLFPLRAHAKKKEEKLVWLARLLSQTVQFVQGLHAFGSQLLEKY